jgi:DNA polymerase III alpha subunit
MLFAHLEDVDQSMEVVVFPEVLTKTGTLWVENTPVLLTGRMSWRDNEGKLMCDNGQLL